MRGSSVTAIPFAAIFVISTKHLPLDSGTIDMIRGAWGAVPEPSFWLWLTCLHYGCTDADDS